MNPTWYEPPDNYTEEELREMEERDELARDEAADRKRDREIEEREDRFL